MSGKDVKKLLVQYPIMSRDRILFKKAAEAFEQLDSTSTSESQWIRYVEATGNNANDGKSVATAWKTITYALSQKPKIHEFALIKIGAGTFDEAIEITSGIGQFVIAGTFTEVYDGVTCTAYTRYGSNSIEKWTEMTLNTAGEPGFVWDDTLKSMYVEYADNTGKIWRQKIIYYSQIDSRIYMAGGAPSSAGATPLALKFVTSGTIIRNTSTSYSQVVLIDSDYGVAHDKSPPWDAPRRGVVLHALKLVDTSAGSYACCLNVAAGASCRLGAVEMSCDSSWEHVNLGYSNEFYFGLFFLTPTLSALIDPRTGVNPGTNSALITYCKAGLMNYGHATLSAVICLGTSSYISNQNILMPTPPRLYIFDLYCEGAVTQKCGELEVFRRCTLGQYLRVRTDIDYAINDCRVSLSSSVNGAISFYGNPSTTYGRISLDDKTQMEIFQDLNLGTVSGHSVAVPLIYLDKNSTLRTKGLTIGAATTNECPAAAPLVKLNRNCKMNVEGLLKLYHSATGSQAAILVDNNSELVCEAATSNIEIHTSSPITSGTGAITVDGQSKLHCLNNVDITHTTNTGTGHSILVSESEAYIEGTYTATTALTGYDLVNDSGRLRISGACTIDTDGKVLSSLGAGSSTKLVGAVTASGTGSSAPVLDISASSQAEFGGDVKVPTKDYGAGALIKVSGASNVYFGAALTDGDGSYNTNSNAGGYGFEVKRRSNVEFASQAGPTGASGDVNLGAVGAKAIPASGASVTDMTDGTEASAQICTIMTR